MRLRERERYSTRSRNHKHVFGKRWCAWHWTFNVHREASREYLLLDSSDSGNRRAHRQMWWQYSLSTYYGHGQYGDYLNWLYWSFKCSHICYFRFLWGYSMITVYVRHKWSSQPLYLSIDQFYLATISKSILLRSFRSFDHEANRYFLAFVKCISILQYSLVAPSNTLLLAQKKAIERWHKHKAIPKTSEHVSGHCLT